ncbi:4-hydroxythreonine-4-phosphate dehydrogenase [Klenkia soli]|uniref:4-hydroxythreonine-4-phosphate dehydrogenase n=1 Tax=Klenkia soli TaxID=1052260 RepID=A0A1H0BJX4_9ACTN|nr:4-hydroxythreonine-4-phosphate dehydrogenase PdxA [Klenkia soli]SDN45881.1 4-hydroxythreonine-4-phosphate dehydrogenase [Klenkia soli]
MTRPPSPAVLVLADDLSGAAETAALLGSQVSVLLAGEVLPTMPAGVCVVDLDARHLPDHVVADRVGAALSAARSAQVLIKVDSLLRGPLAAAVGAAGAVVVAPALPALGRTVVDGVPSAAGRPLSALDAWATEGRPAPATVAQALAPLPVAVVPLGVVRSPRLGSELQALLGAGSVPVCDGETDADLDAVVAAVAQLPGVALAGSGGLAAALGRTLGAAVGAAPGVRGVGAGPLVVVGTAEPVAAVQVAQLVAAGVDELVVPVAALVEPLAEARWAAEVADRLTRGPLVLRPDPADAVRPASSRALSAGLSRLVADALQLTDAVVDLVLTGGETARRVLDALDVVRLTPRGSVHHGAVLSTADDGRTVVTRPGSFGDADSLLTILTALTPRTPTEGTLPMSTLTTPATTPGTSTDPRPWIAVTMGDGAGVGPEVVVGALVDEASYADCRPVVVGDAARLQQAADLLGLAARIVVVEGPEQAVFEPGRINVVDLGLLPADLPFGQLSPVAGHAAYEYIRVAAELAMAGRVQGICTAPLNKEALHSAGHVYPGHTELLAHFCGIEEVSMMLSSPKIRVIHVTTHIGLIDAIAKIEPGLVERTVRRGHDALVRAGIENPRIGVCGINPHAGENGLFGYGEEEEKIVPAIEVLQADGIDARGPMPADTAFFVAGRGDYDLIVAMYHDQGHGPVKILGIEAGVNITVGLPVIRTSVDHGTAFDIAGTGKVDVRSMVEALRQAAQMSPSPATQTSPAPAA